MPCGFRDFFSSFFPLKVYCRLMLPRHGQFGPQGSTKQKWGLKGTTKHCYIQHIEAMSPVVSKRNVRLYFFFLVVSLRENYAPGEW